MHNCKKAKHGVTADKAEAFYTSVLSKYSFQEFDVENICTICVVRNRMSHDKLMLRFCNKIIYTCEYLLDGLSHGGIELHRNSSKPEDLSYL